MPEKSEYVPGVCNIGRSEIKVRNRIGWYGLAITIILWIAFHILRVPSPWRLVLIIPATISAIGFIQAKMHFCAAFGMLGVFNLRSVGRTDTIEQAEYRRKDRHKALLIFFYSVLIGSVFAAVDYFL